MDKEVATLVWNTPTKTYLDYADSFEEFAYRMHEIVKACKMLHKKTPWGELLDCLNSRFGEDFGNVDCYGRSKRLVKSCTDLCIERNDFTKGSFCINGKPDICADSLDLKEVLTTICQWRVYDKNHHLKHDWVCDTEMLDMALSSIDYDNDKACEKQVKGFLSLFENGFEEA